LYSVTGLTDASGVPVVRYGYDAYGLPRAVVGSPPVGLENSYFFTGRRLDFDVRDEDGSVTGQPGRPVLVLYDCRAREYDPWHGRFCQRDPALYAESLNLYQYALSNPLGRLDPVGMFSFADILSTMRIGAQVYGLADTAMTLRQAVSAFVGGASLYNVALSLGIELALDKFGGSLLDPVTDLASPLLNKIGRKLSKGLKGAVELKWEMHHVFPMFLTGKGSGHQVPLPKELHTAYHGGLLRALREKGIYLEWKGQKWEEYFRRHKEKLNEALIVLMNYTRDFDRAQGTNLLNALWQAFVDQKVLKW